jgi:hypothetical protein
MKQLNRRTLLRGACGVALGLPFLDAMLPISRQAREQTPGAPRRIIFEFKPNGDQIDRRFISTGETNFELDEFLAPLEPYRNELLFLNKLDKRFYKLPEGQSADAHEQGGSSLAPWPSGAGSFPIGGTDQTIGYVLGPSADFVIGERVLATVPTVPQRHLVYRVGSRENNIWNLHSHGGPVGTQNPIAPETNPYDAYARIFSFTDGDDAAAQAVQRRLAMRQSALDLVIEEADTLKLKVDASDRAKLEQHLEALRDIERTLQGAPQGGAACVATDLGTRLDPYDDDNHAQIGEVFQRITALAFACDLTRSVNFNWHGNTSNRVYRNLGFDVGHHDISHEGTDESFVSIRQIHKHLWTESTKLYDALKAVPEGDGTLWDNTLIVHWNELGQGDSHTTQDCLVVFAGGAAGHFRMGRYIDFDNDLGFSDMLLTCFDYMGFGDEAQFGDPIMGGNVLLPGVT